MTKPKTFNARRISLSVFFLLPLFALPLSAQNPAPAAGTFTLDDTLKILGASGTEAAAFRWDPFFASGTISSGAHEASFIAGGIRESGAVLLDHREILTLPLPYMEKGILRFPEAFVTRIKSSFGAYAEDDRSRFKIAAIIIDPGHGGKDEGAARIHRIRGKTVNSVEKDIVLKVSRQLRASLAARFPDKQVLLTREGDTYPTLEERVNLANSLPLAGNEAAIYISVHANSSPNPEARGFEVWYLSPGYRRQVLDRSKYTDDKEVADILNNMLEEELTTESILMARSILGQLDGAIGKTTPSRGLKEWDWYVVRNARMPSVLVELPFVSNVSDARLMSDDAYLKNISEALYKGIADFVASFERSGGFTIIQ